MGKIGIAVLYPYGSVILFDGKGMNSIEGFKMGVRWWGTPLNEVGSQADVDLSGVSEEATFSHVRQDDEFSVEGVPPLVE